MHGYGSTYVGMLLLSEMILVLILDTIPFVYKFVRDHEFNDSVKVTEVFSFTTKTHYTWSQKFAVLAYACSLYLLSAWFCTPDECWKKHFELFRLNCLRPVW